MGQVPDSVTKAENKFSILGEFSRVWILVNAMDGGNRAFLKLSRDSLVCGQHELFDQLVRLIVFDALQSYGTSLFIQPDLYLWKVEVERAMLESFPPQQGSEFP